MDSLFEVHILNEDGKARARDIAESFDKLVKHLDCICPPGRPMSIAKTKLEEACFFAKKAMASQTENQALELNR